MDSRQLIIMRHATADPAGERDHGRILTSRGDEEARQAGRSLRLQGAKPQHVLCSTAIRCRETWQALATELDGDAPRVDYENGLYNAPAEALQHFLCGVVEARRVLILAHNPGVSTLALELAGGDEDGVAQLSAGFTPASVAYFEIDGAWAQLSSRIARLTRFERTPTG